MKLPSWRIFRRSRIRDAQAPIELEGQRRSRGSTRTRVVLVMSAFIAIYGTIAGRLVYYSVQTEEESAGPVAHVTAARPDILDRNGEVLATDIKTSSLFAEPRRIVDVDEAVEKLSLVLPDMQHAQTYAKLQNKKSGFVWLRRQLTPKQQADIMALGIPGIGFRTENRRFYPGGDTASHILGLVNIDNQGIAGMEKYIDSQGLSDLQASGLADPRDLEPIRLSIDIRVQHIVRDELMNAMGRYGTIGAGAVILNCRTGEVMAMASVPDFDPNNPFNAHEKDRLNRVSGGTYEMGSTIKSFTSAMALDSGKVTLQSRFDASHPITIGRQTIHDFHSKNRVLTMPEVFIYSSNIGSAREADVVGIEGHRAFLKRMGLLDKVKTELPEVATPYSPKVWKKVNSITIAFGHGMSTTPLQTAVGAVALMNGGKLIPPTFLPRTEQEADLVAKQVVSEKVVEDMRYLYKLNGDVGSGKKAEVEGFRVGGKTGTAEKVIHGRYVSDKRFNAFLAAFPMDDPQYVVLVFVDEPKPEKPGLPATAAFNAAPTTAAIIRRAAPLLGVEPRFDIPNDTTLVSLH